LLAQTQNLIKHPGFHAFVHLVKLHNQKQGSENQLVKIAFESTIGARAFSGTLVV
jgi:hypothetical protein